MATDLEAVTTAADVVCIVDRPRRQPPQSTVARLDRGTTIGLRQLEGLAHGNASDRSGSVQPTNFRDCA